jgi:superoxide dismutase, Fe-Mn family
MKNSRRVFIQKTLNAVALGSVAAPLIAASDDSRIAGKNSVQHGTAAFEFAQIKLPYTYNALEPHIDGQTMEIHYTRHHAAYVKNVNEALAAEKTSYGSENEIFANVSKLSAKIRNNAGGAWNHNFFWTVMKGGSSAVPTGKVLEAINSSFGSLEKFKEQFTQAAMTRFGSGWAWLVKENDKLKIGSTPNQDNPLMDVSDFKGTPLLALDVWEHAYYLKYQNKRIEYVANWWNIVNWDEVNKRLG